MHLALRVARRLGIFVVSLLGASLLIFLLTNALPGDVAQVLLGTDATPEARGGSCAPSSGSTVRCPCST